MIKNSLLPLCLITISLTACKKENPNTAIEQDNDTQVTETVLDNVDTIEGTISDAMINVEGLDESSDTAQEIADETSGNAEKPVVKDANE